MKKIISGFRFKLGNIGAIAKIDYFRDISMDCILVNIVRQFRRNLQIIKSVINLFTGSSIQVIYAAR